MQTSRQLDVRPDEWVVAPEQTEKITQKLVEKGIELTKERYGEKPYHNEDHALEVVSAVREIGEAEGLTDEEISLLVIAAAWHDVETGLGPGESEDVSAKQCGDEMRTHGFGEMEIEVVGALIRATKNTIINGEIKQEAGNSEEKFGEYRLRRMELVLADGDLAGCGYPWEQYETRSIALGVEYKTVKADKNEMSINDWIYFWEGQEKFQMGLLKRNFLTEGARKNFPHLGDNLRMIRVKLANLRIGPVGVIA